MLCSLSYEFGNGFQWNWITGFSFEIDFKELEFGFSDMGSNYNVDFSFGSGS
jgi:hypothetical protein